VNQTEKADYIFENLWNQYVSLNSDVEKIHGLFTAAGHQVTNDHVALRTFNHKKVCIDVLAKPFIDAGYCVSGHYNFEKKKLDAVHLEHSSNKDLPKVFISELRLEEFSEELKNTVSTIIEAISDNTLTATSFPFSGRTWDPLTTETYQKIRKESEYAAWVCVFGYMANHFTVKINKLNPELGDISKVNNFIEANGYELNSVGGKVKGTAEVCLEQSSTLADRRNIEFADGSIEIPTCFYEFAYRHKLPSGEEFSGFIADNADKIFSSTDAK
jgi:hypothetical protein